MDSKPIVLESVFNAPASRVWSALTNKDEMKKWYFDLAEFKLEVGFKFQFFGGPDGGVQYLHLCEITEVIPERKVTCSWRYDNYAGNSFVTFELLDQNSKTTLRLTHSGIETFPQENPDFAIGNFVEGWTQIINTSLKVYLEQIVA